MQRASAKAQGGCNRFYGSCCVGGGGIFGIGNVCAKSRPVGAKHPSGLVLDIVGIAAGDRGRRCEDHMVCCGQLLEKDFILRLRKEKILVPNVLAVKGKKRYRYVNGHYCQLGGGRRRSLPCGVSPAGICPRGSNLRGGSLSGD